MDVVLLSLENSHQVSLNSVLNEVVVLRSLVCSVASTSNPTGGCLNKIKLPELKPFGGVWNAKEFEDLIWDMEHYFKAAHVPDDEKVKKVNINSMHMSGDAKLWWRTGAEDGIRPEVLTWEKLR